MRGGGQAVARLVDVAERESEQVVRRRIVPQLGCAGGDCIGDAGHRRQFVVIDFHRIGSGARCLTGLSDDECDAVAHEAHLVASQHVARRGDLARKRHDARDDAVAGDIGMGIDRDDARDGFRCSGVDRYDPRMAIGRAHGRGEQRSGSLQVVGIAPAAGQQAEILDALGRLADPELHG